MLSSYANSVDISPTVKHILEKNQLLRNRHKDERCFILATGPSIGKMNLKLLEGENCIGVSHYYKHPHVEFIKPEYCCIAPYHLPIKEEYWHKWMKEIDDKTGDAVIFFGLSDFGRNQKDGLFEGRKLHFLDMSGSWESHGDQAIDLTAAVPGIQSVTIMAIYVALYMGFKNIYLLGFDHDAMLHRAAGNHFYEEYDESLHDPFEPGTRQAIEFDIEEQCMCYLFKWNQYKRLKKIADRTHVEIHNATPGGLLNLFPRVEYNSLFSPSKIERFQAGIDPGLDADLAVRKMLQQAVTKLGKGQADEALKIADEIISIDAKLPHVNYIRSVCLGRQNRYREALAAAVVELSTDPNHREALAQIQSLSARIAPIEPLSRKFGLDRGTSICRYYIDRFLSQNKSFIRGHVMEIGDSSYTNKFGSAVSACDVFSLVNTPGATIVGDLSTGKNVPESEYDCVIMTQTIQFIYEARSALRHTIQSLKPGGPF